MWSCPVNNCDTEIDKDFEFVTTLRCQRNVQGHQQFKKSLQLFFLNVLQKYTFGKESRINKEVTDMLMSFIITTKLPGSDVGGNIKTKNISPFEGMDHLTQLLRKQHMTGAD